MGWAGPGALVGSSLVHQNQDAVGAEQCAEDGGGSGIMYLCSNLVILYGKGQ